MFNPLGSKFMFGSFLLVISILSYGWFISYHMLHKNTLSFDNWQRLLLKIFDCASDNQHADVCSGAKLHKLWKVHSIFNVSLVKLCLFKVEIFLGNRVHTWKGKARK